MYMVYSLWLTPSFEFELLCIFLSVFMHIVDFLFTVELYDRRAYHAYTIHHIHKYICVCNKYDSPTALNRILYMFMKNMLICDLCALWVNYQWLCWWYRFYLIEIGRSLLTIIFDLRDIFIMLSGEIFRKKIKLLN